MKKLGIVLFFLINFLFSEEFFIIKVNSGFYNREKEVVKVEINFGNFIDIESLKLRENNKDIPFYFEMKDGERKGDLYFEIDKMAQLTQKIFNLYFKKSEKLDKKSIGDKSLKEKYIDEDKNLVQNGGFEETGVWTLYPRGTDYSQIIETDKYEGKKSLLLKTESKEKLIRGYIIGEPFPLKPNTKYKFSYMLKILNVSDKVEEGNYHVSGEVQFLDENKKRIYPKDYAVNRLQAAYRLDNKDLYLNKWVEVSAIKRTPEEVRFGMIQINSLSIEGTCLIDNIILKEINEKEPVVIEIKKGGE